MYITYVYITRTDEKRNLEFERQQEEIQGAFGGKKEIRVEKF